MKTILVASSPYTDQCVFAFEIEHIYDCHEAIVGSIMQDLRHLADEGALVSWGIKPGAGFTWDDVTDILADPNRPKLTCVDAIKAINPAFCVVGSEWEIESR